MKSLKTYKQSELLQKCSFAFICNNTSHIQLSNEGTLKNQPINQSTNKQQTCKSFRKCLLWVSDSLTVNISIFCTLTLKAVQTSNNQQACKAAIKKVLCKWLTEYLNEWFTLLRLCASRQDIHVCSLTYWLTFSFSLPPTFVCHPQHPLCLLFCSSTE